MILTVTLHTALDLTYRVRSLRPRASHRVTDVVERPGGKGVNVARVLAALGHEVTVTGFTGGATGATVRALLAADAEAVRARLTGEERARAVITASQVRVAGYEDPITDPEASVPWPTAWELLPVS